MRLPWALQTLMKLVVPTGLRLLSLSISGLPTFDWASVLSMIIVMLVVMVETTGDSIAIGEIVDKPIGRKELGFYYSC